MPFRCVGNQNLGTTRLLDTDWEQQPVNNNITKEDTDERAQKARHTVRRSPAPHELRRRTFVNNY